MKTLLSVEIETDQVDPLDLAKTVRDALLVLEMSNGDHLYLADHELHVTVENVYE